MCRIDLTNLPAEISTEVGRLGATYDFTKLSEKGQNGYLFLARNRVLDRDVAIKFYYWADGTRSHVEPKSLASVGSPYVIEVLEASLVGPEWAMFVTPLCQNGDLDRYLETNRFGVREALRFTSNLLEGVSALHGNGYVHRDLKPENLLVSDSVTPLIADFGSVRVVPSGQSHVSGSGHAMLYRPPESFASRRYDRRGDVYQCGMVMYQILGGRLPYSYYEYLTPQERVRYANAQGGFERSRIVEDAIEARARRGKLLDLQSLPFFVPAGVRKVLTKATAVDPSDRYDNASAFINAVNTLAPRIVDWQWHQDTPIAVVGGARLRVCPDGELFRVEQDKGNGWRSAPGSGRASLKKQLVFIEDKAKR